jgi:hypothetical protein
MTHTAGVFDTGGIFTAGVVVHVDLQIDLSQRIFGKI